MDRFHTLELLVPSEYVGRKINPCNVTEMDRAVSVRESGCDQILHSASNKGIYRWKIYYKVRSFLSFDFDTFSTLFYPPFT
jgi:hypothetical protein